MTLAESIPLMPRFPVCTACRGTGKEPRSRVISLVGDVIVRRVERVCVKCKGSGKGEGDGNTS